MSEHGETPTFPASVERVAVDFDGVINNFHERLCARIREKHGVDYHPEDITEWNPQLPHGKELLEEIKPLIDSEDTLDRSGPVPGAREGLHALADAGYTITIATHRPETIYASIRKWFGEHNISYHEFVTDVPQNKGLLEADLLIDDRPMTVRNAIDEGKHAIHFTGIWDGSAVLNDLLNERQSGNDGTGMCDGGPMLRRADSWSEVCRLLDC